MVAVVADDGEESADASTLPLRNMLLRAAEWMLLAAAATEFSNAAGTRPLSHAAAASNSDRQTDERATHSLAPTAIRSRKAAVAKAAVGEGAAAVAAKRSAALSGPSVVRRIDSGVVVAVSAPTGNKAHRQVGAVAAASGEIRCVEFKARHRALCHRVDTNAATRCLRFELRWVNRKEGASPSKMQLFLPGGDVSQTIR